MLSGSFTAQVAFELLVGVRAHGDGDIPFRAVYLAIIVVALANLAPAGSRPSHDGGRTGSSQSPQENRNEWELR